MRRSSEFSDLLEATERLSLEEKETLLEVLHNRTVEQRRAQLQRDVAESRRELAAGTCKPASPAMILDWLWIGIDGILGRISQSHLQRYDFLQASLLKTGVDADKNYQRTFNGFYKMGRRNDGWYQFYFSLLEREKTNVSVTFSNIFEGIFRHTKRVEPSFSSKLVATIRPEMPVYDKHVRVNLFLKVPAQHRPQEERVREFISAYGELERRMAAMIGDTIFIAHLKPAFNRKFPEYVHLTDGKKLDLMLWQYRPARAMK